MTEAEYKSWKYHPVTQEIAAKVRELAGVQFELIGRTAHKDIENTGFKIGYIQGAEDSWNLDDLFNDKFGDV